MIRIISEIIITISILTLLYKYLIMKKNTNYPQKEKNGHNYAILIPARNESLVIEKLLISIENQTKKIKPEDVYVIVETKKDKTVSIVEKHKMTIVYRKNLNKKRKGFALDDAIKEILKSNKKYDAYFIFDADNILDKNYIKEMTKSFDEGYDIGIGYRNTKNSKNLVSAASALTFSMINTIGNKRKSKYTNNLIISGTGYYIKGTIIESWKGFPFNSLTEDYELSLYSILNNLTTTYNDSAIYYDEQPEIFDVTITQRSRWVKGYFDARRNYIHKIRKSISKKDKNYASKITALIGVNPLITLIIGILLLLIDSITSFKNFIISLLIIFILIYITLMIFTYIIIKKEENKLDIKVSKILLIFYNPFYLLSYIYCLYIAVTKKDLGWQEIKHTNNTI
ncbi:MAG: glycosyltransferase family 2 protein [Bacilli bacterium]|nr:glycosyltransferase family 2 protein [Bacilli bacterium]MDY5996123.1 glycosyltransferase family 2 protein [Bacilli bacterium]MEE1370664.1 glycosyltransferase family 2 protein [Bacilli bacterium]